MCRGESFLHPLGGANFDSRLQVLRDGNLGEYGENFYLLFFGRLKVVSHASKHARHSFDASEASAPRSSGLRKLLRAVRRFTMAWKTSQHVP